MEQLYKKLLELSTLLKATKTPSEPHAHFKVPSLPTVKPPAKPSMNVGASKDAKIPGMAPTGKKDPKKIAEQIKSGQISTKTQKIMLKFEKNGQWSLEKAEDEKPAAAKKPLRFPDKPEDHPFNRVPDDKIIPLNEKHVDVSHMFTPKKKKLDN